MKSRCLSPMNKRGFTMAEVLVAAALLLLVVGGTAGLMGTAGQLEQAVNLQSTTDQGASRAMNRMVAEIREAKEVEILNAHRFRVYYPSLLANGHYDRFRLNDSQYIEFAQTDATGRPSPTGNCLWRRTESDTGRAVAENLKLLRVNSNSRHSIRLTVHTEKAGRGRKSETRLNGRVLYLRNN